MGDIRSLKITTRRVNSFEIFFLIPVYKSYKSSTINSFKISSSSVSARHYTLYDYLLLSIELLGGGCGWGGLAVAVAGAAAVAVAGKEPTIFLFFILMMINGRYV